MQNVLVVQEQGRMCIKELWSQGDNVIG